MYFHSGNLKELYWFQLQEIDIHKYKEIYNK